MDIESDQEIVQLIGSEYMDVIAPSLEECAEAQVM